MPGVGTGAPAKPPAVMCTAGCCIISQLPQAGSTWPWRVGLPWTWAHTHTNTHTHTHTNNTQPPRGRETRPTPRAGGRHADRSKGPWWCGTHTQTHTSEIRVVNRTHTHTLTDFWTESHTHKHTHEHPYRFLASLVDEVQQAIRLHLECQLPRDSGREDGERGRPRQREGALEASQNKEKAGRRARGKGGLVNASARSRASQNKNEKTAGTKPNTDR